MSVSLAQSSLPAVLSTLAALSALDIRQVGHASSDARDDRPHFGPLIRQDLGRLLDCSNDDLGSRFAFALLNS